MMRNQEHYDEKSRTLNMIMEYADDGDISHKIQDNLKRRLRFEESTIWEWILQLLKGLKYLHDNKIMHRDIKCANIFLMKNGLLKIGDLNVSKFAKSNMARTQTGTPHRDLKCANIFLMKNGLLKIGDLNVSKFAKSNMARTQTGTINVIYGP